MEDKESINVIYNRFIDIVVALQNLGKDLGLDEINKKLFALLPIEWRPKVTAIEEAKNLTTITIKELLGSFITHEHTLQRDCKEKEIDNKKKRDIALQSLMGDDNDIDMALVTRHFNFILFLKNKAIAKIGEKRSEKPQCYDVRVLVT